MSSYPYTYAWRNNPVRVRFKGRRCRITCSGTMNTVCLEFENGEGVITSRRALRKAHGPEGEGKVKCPNPYCEEDLQYHDGAERTPEHLACPECMDVVYDLDGNEIAEFASR